MVKTTAQFEWRPSVTRKNIYWKISTLNMTTKRWTHITQKEGKCKPPSDSHLTKHHTEPSLYECALPLKLHVNEPKQSVHRIRIHSSAISFPASLYLYSTKAHMLYHQQHCPYQSTLCTREAFFVFLFYISIVVAPKHKTHTVFRSMFVIPKKYYLL